MRFFSDKHLVKFFNMQGTTGGGQIAKSDDQETGVHIKTSLRLRKFT